MKKGLECEELEEDLKAFLSILSDIGTPVVVTAHRNADPDAVGSAYVIRNVLRRRGIDARLLFPEGVSQVSKRVIKEVIGVEPSEIEDEAPKESAAVVILDTASYEQLGGLADFARQVIKIVIDHHSASKLAEEADIAFYDPNARATSEIVYLLVRDCMEESLETAELEALLAGIVYDTRHFILSTPRVLRVAARILEEGASLERVLRSLQSPPPDISQRIARIKAAKRMHAIRAGELIVVVTHVGAYESSVARALLDLGADIALVVSEHGAETRIVARSRRDVEEKYGIHLGRDIMEQLAKRLGGGGGGHAQAAAMTTRASLEKALSEVIKIVEELLRSRGLEPQVLV
ncbi:bifunctional oligoribonuclease/PAP phosphatase NrnA [Pyrofollis japonicus]|uniref:DHH family phosphoesterase n=1 Tax=Pyrofollis japonicus TaxID=3060460 RepID=UPI00295A9029|nr:DHH family phosphoesterase [Pyrofollis japonicus]BEP18476.1 bifunctional oligoribonuclease/PAP phosphatase NrnA [Pyrofollis japonicus]